MKYLIITSMKDTFSTLQTETKRQLLELEANWIYRYKSAGTLSEVHMIAGRNKIVAITNHESPEDLHNVLSTWPTYMYMDLEIYPLADIYVSMNTLIKSLKSGT